MVSALAGQTERARQMADSSVSPVRMRTTCSTG
jgi:hypothetical protein